MQHDFKYPLELSTFLKPHRGVWWLPFPTVPHLCLLFQPAPTPQCVFIWRLNVMSCTRCHQRQMLNEELNLYKFRGFWGFQWTCWLALWLIGPSEVCTAKDKPTALCCTFSQGVQLESYTSIKRKFPKYISLVSDTSISKPDICYIFSGRVHSHSSAFMSTEGSEYWKWAECYGPHVLKHHSESHSEH